MLFLFLTLFFWFLIGFILGLLFILFFDFCYFCAGIVRHHKIIPWFFNTLLNYLFILIKFLETICLFLPIFTITILHISLPFAFFLLIPSLSLLNPYFRDPKISLIIIFLCKCCSITILKSNKSKFLTLSFLIFNYFTISYLT